MLFPSFPAFPYSGKRHSPLRTLQQFLRQFIPRRQILSLKFGKGEIIRVPVQLADEGVEPAHGHQRNALKDPDLLFYQRDNDRDGILVRDALVKQGPLPVLHNCLIEMK